MRAKEFSVENRKYKDGEKYQGIIPEIKYLPLTAIERQELDFRPEVMTVSDEVAKNMDFSEPIEVTAFRFGKNDDEARPQVTLRDGHHRYAAALQTGRKYLPVVVKAINAKGEKLNALIQLSDRIKQGDTSSIQENSNSKTVTLNKLYGGNFPDRDESFWDEVRSSEFDSPLEVKTMPRYKLSIMLQGQYGVEHLDEILDRMSEEQQEVLERYMADPGLSQKIILISGDRIIDGNHRALAAAMKGVSINYVDLADLEEQDMSESKKRCQQCGMPNCTCAPGKCGCKPIAGWIPNKGFKKAINKQDVTEDSSDTAAAYKAHLLKTMPQIMKLFANTGKGWSPSKEQMLAAVDTGYETMKRTGDVKQAGKALMHELNTLHRMSKQGVAEDADFRELLKQPQGDKLITNVPKFLFHATPSKNIDSIKSKGLELRSDNPQDRYEPRIYVAGTVIDALKIANQLRQALKSKQDYTILKINTSGLKNNFYVDPYYSGGVYTDNIIPPDSISVELQIPKEAFSTKKNWAQFWNWKVWNKEEPSFIKQGVAEDTVDEGSIPVYKSPSQFYAGAGKTLYKLFRNAFPNLPEHVANDIYNQTSPGTNDTIVNALKQGQDPKSVFLNYYSGITFNFSKDPGTSLTPQQMKTVLLNGRWRQKILTVNPADFAEHSRNRMVKRNFGINPDEDPTRIQRQQSRAKGDGSNEPVIIIQTSNGLILWEGFHRTMSILALGKNGEDPLRWNKVKLRAWVVEIPNQQGVAEDTSNNIPTIGINVRSDGNIDYASLIVDCKKKYESRRTDSLRPYVGKTVGIVRTGNGPAVAIGQATIGEPIIVDVEKFNKLRNQHLVPKGSKFDIASDSTKYLYPMINPVRWDNEKPITSKGIVSRKIQEAKEQVNIQAHRQGDTAWIDYFEVLPKRQGLGTIKYQEWEKNLPSDIKKIRLVASDAGEGPSHNFWDMMGFEYMYDDDEGPIEMVKHLDRKDTVDEMALSTYKTMGDFDKPGPFRGPDKKLVPHPKNIEKATKFFEQTPFDFRLFFSNISGTGRYSEYGPMTPDEIMKIFGKDAEEIVNGSDDAINVVFVGNKGDAKVMLTPWMMAHRFGHAIQAGQRRNRGWSAWSEAEKYFFETVNSLLGEHYGKIKSQTPGVTSKVNYNLTPEYNALFNAIGTQRSSKRGQIRRPYEFLYELFAQYLGTGKVTLNPLPTNLTYGRKAWGNPTKFMNIKPEYRDEVSRKEESDRLAYTMELLFNDVLSSSVGQIFVM